MFSQASISHFVQGGIGSFHASWDRSHGRTSDLGIPPPSIYPTPCPLLMTSGGRHWRLFQTCSLDLRPYPLSSEFVFRVPRPLLSHFLWNCWVSLRTVHTGRMWARKSVSFRKRQRPWSYRDGKRFNLKHQNKPPFTYTKTSKLQRTRVFTIYLQTFENKIYLSYRLSHLWCYPRHENKDPHKLVRFDAYDI